MKKVTASVVGLPVLVVTLGLMGGCATSTDMGRAEKTAQEAKQAADQANATANKALETANAAKQAADAAQQQAAEAKQMSQENSEKMNRMFQKATKK